jgi:hypothetical protein
MLCAFMHAHVLNRFGWMGCFATKHCFVDYSWCACMHAVLQIAMFQASAKQATVVLL